jgi:hypothetical protein
MTPVEFAGKVEWEGGVLDAWEYGLRADEIEEGTHLRILWRQLDELMAPLAPLVQSIERLLEEALEEDDQE